LHINFDGITVHTGAPSLQLRGPYGGRYTVRQTEAYTFKLHHSRKIY